MLLRSYLIPNPLSLKQNKRVGVVPPWLPSSAQNRGNHGGIAPTKTNRD